MMAGDPATVWDGATLDSRRVAGGELFFALAGESTDGHRFAGDALAAGAAAAVVERPVEAPEGACVVRVRDSFVALHDLTRALREELDCRIVGITGSAGKTTTKELLAEMLAVRWRVARNPGNLNNLYGFPVAFLGIPDDTEWMVAEMGMSTPGELGRISRLGRPDVAMLLNVRPVHLEFFGELRAIARAKGEILEGLAADGRIVANRDDPEVRWILRGEEREVVWFGFGDDATVVAREVEPVTAGDGSRFRLVTPDGEATVELPLLGLHNVENCLAAAACAWRLGLDTAGIAAAVAGVRPAARRGEVHRLADGAVVLDDCYNANPVAVERALDAAARLPAARRWAVLGDMLELGPEAGAFHRRVGREAARRGFSPVVGVGELARGIAEAAAEAGAESEWYPAAPAAAAALGDRLRPADVVLVKGSRGIALEAVVDALVEGRRRAGEED